VFFAVTGEGVRDVHRRKDGEDVRLEESHQNLECGDADQHDQRQDSHRHQETSGGLSQEQRFAEQAEGDEEDVASHQVGHETHRQRERGHEDGRDEFDQAHQRLQEHRHSGRPQQVGEVAETLVLDAGPDERGPHQQRQCQRNRQTGGGWHLQDRNDAGQVGQVDEDEQAHQERGPTQSLLANRLHDDAVLDEIDDRLGKVPHAAGSLGVVLARGQIEDRQPDQGREDGDQPDLVEGREDVLPSEDCIDRREFESEHVIDRSW
jgi:hypothetical protein